jgi:hypothetical protein
MTHDTKTKMTKRKMNLNMTPTIMVTMTTIRRAIFAWSRKKESAYCTATTSCNDSKNCCRSSSEGGTCKDEDQHATITLVAITISAIQ